MWICKKCYQMQQRITLCGNTALRHAHERDERAEPATTHARLTSRSVPCILLSCICSANILQAWLQYFY